MTLADVTPSFFLHKFSQNGLNSDSDLLISDKNQNAIPQIPAFWVSQPFAMASVLQWEM